LFLIYFEYISFGSFQPKKRQTGQTLHQQYNAIKHPSDA